MTTHSRLCEPGCPQPDKPHRDPEPDWIGNVPIMHGESDHEVPGTGRPYLTHTATFLLGVQHYCLCGHPNYQTCPAWWDGGGIAAMVITATDDKDGDQR